MVLLLVAIAVGIIIVTVLIVKYTKTNPRAVLGMDRKCNRCGTIIDGAECPKCKNNKMSFGV
ncbi:hypothetical protein NsoK4_06935 [Nitrosopumilus sp. K4]|uniref:hypothetical protein n=1 Tax=Nitrosopumilus sp. K4 TaxID=2795383 RepID=UPI001BAB4E77|nr:hypothetical protein [Nitrosopumilus sp. K4]QUC64174.1 hypothetical protein NsoK4_06935 [Nitrosopumilus sp. K4]